MKKQNTVCHGVLSRNSVLSGTSTEKLLVLSALEHLEALSSARESATSVLACFCLIDLEGASAHVGAVEGIDGLVAVFITDLDEAEATGAAGFSIEDDTSALNGAELTEEIGEFLISGREGKIAHVDIHKIT
jgi:hypothetical protein